MPPIRLPSFALASALACLLAGCDSSLDVGGSGSDSRTETSARTNKAPAPTEVRASGAVDGASNGASNGAHAGADANAGPRRRPPGIDGVDLGSLGGSSQTPLTVPDVPSTAPTVASKLLVVDGADTARFGQLVEGAEADHVFEVFLEGDEPITIFDQRATCGCTVGSIEVLAGDGTASKYTMGSELAKGSRLRVHGTLRTEGKQGDNHHTITLRHNGSNRATLLHFQAEVVPIFELEPGPYLNFQELFVNETKTTSVTVSSPVLDVFRLELDTSFAVPPYLRLDLAPVDPQSDGRAKKWILTGTIGPDTPANLGGQQGLTILLKSDEPLPGAAPLPDGSPRMRGLSLFAAARVKPLVNAQPAYVSFGAVSPGSSAERIFTIEFADKFVPDLALMEKAYVRAREADDQAFYDELFVVRAAPGTKAGTYDITLAFENWPESEIGPFGGSIQVNVGHPTREIMEVPFSGVSRVPPRTSGR